MVGIRIEQAGSVGKRTMRRPQHTFHIRQRPWQIQPFFIAPVLPGETMKSLMFQARVVTDPIRNPLIGWWAEYYFFYVKHRDLAIRDDATTMMINPGFDIDAAQPQAVDLAFFHQTTGVSWVHECLQRVVEEYFRNEKEGWLDFFIDSLPISSLGISNVMDSLIVETEEDDVDIDLTDVAGPEGAKVMASEVEAALQQWQFARMNNLTDMTYEDYLKSYGISGAAVIEPHKPELIRFIREWTYPTNTINPSDGAPSSACSWAVAETANKDRFFREPGFIFGVTVMRPKIYLDNHIGTFADQMNNAMTWLPAVLENEIRPGRVSIPASTAPLAGVAVETIVDVRDLLLYGEQFINFPFTATDANLIALPIIGVGGGVNSRYATAADANLMFVSVDPDNKIRQDGVVNLQIATRQIDVTPTVRADV